MTPMDRTLPSDALLIVRQADALSSVLRVVTHHTNPQPALQAVSEVLALRPPSESIEEYVVRAAMLRILRTPLDEPSIDFPVPLQQHPAEVIGLAWVHRTNKPLDQLLSFDSRLPATQSIERHTLMLWLTAIQLHPDPLDGRPHDICAPDFSRNTWKRATELAVTFGLDATDMIRWTFAASMMPKTP